MSRSSEIILDLIKTWPTGPAGTKHNWSVKRLQYSTRTYNHSDVPGYGYTLEQLMSLKIRCEADAISLLRDIPVRTGNARGSSRAREEGQILWCRVGKIISDALKTGMPGSYLVTIRGPKAYDSERVMYVYAHTTPEAVSLATMMLSHLVGDGQTIDAEFADGVDINQIASANEDLVKRFRAKAAEFRRDAAAWLERAEKRSLIADAVHDLTQQQVALESVALLDKVA